MVFLRPTIVRNAADAQRHTAARYGYLREQQLRGDPTALAELDAVVRDYLRANPPVTPVAAPAPAPAKAPVQPGAATDGGSPR